MAGVEFSGSGLRSIFQGKGGRVSVEGNVVLSSPLARPRPTPPAHSCNLAHLLAAR